MKTTKLNEALTRACAACPGGIWTPAASVLSYARDAAELGGEDLDAVARGIVRACGPALRKLVGAELAAELHELTRPIDGARAFQGDDGGQCVRLPNGCLVAVGPGGLEDAESDENRREFAALARVVLVDGTSLPALRFESAVAPVPRARYSSRALWVAVALSLGATLGAWVACR